MIHSKEISLIEAGQTKDSCKKQFRGQLSEELLIVMSHTRSILRLNDRQYYMQPFTFLIHEFEGGQITMETQERSTYRYLHLHFSKAHLAKIQERRITPKEVFTLARPLAADEVWKLLVAANDSPSESAYALAVHSMNLLLCLLWEASDGTVTLAAEVPHYDKLSALRHRIYQNPADSWFIQDICDEMGISRPYFHKIYQAAFGTTCTQDVISSRIVHAKHLLETTDEPIATVSQQSGFETDVYFMRQFKKHAGMTPTAYRRIFRQSKAKK